MKISKVTIISVSYNHEKFIRQTLESFVSQRTNFPFEVFIADDASTDKTTDIIKEFSINYPNIIKPTLREKNLGIYNNSIQILKQIKSQYVALCDGDDYWTDPLKLQKQVDFLDSHPDYSICFCYTKAFFEDKSHPDYIIPDPKIKNLSSIDYMQTCSVMYRWRFNDKEKIEDFFTKDIYPPDYFLNFFHSQKGKIGFIPEIMAAYRICSSGIYQYQLINNNYNFYLNFCEKLINSYQIIIDKHNASKIYYTCRQACQLRKLLFACIKLKEYKKLKLVIIKYLKLKPILLILSLFSIIEIPIRKILKIHDK